MKNRLLLLSFVAGLLFIACNPARRSSGPAGPTSAGKPGAGKPTPMDTVRWSANNSGKPPIGNGGEQPGDPEAQAGGSYHIAFLLPFLSNQMSGGQVSEKSRLAVQFYTGAQIALEQLSQESDIQLSADVWDTQANDEDFQKLMTNPRLERASVFIGPVRGSHVEAFARWALERRKIMVSPESPSADLTTQNPDFIQINPSLRAHCEAITQWLIKQHRTDNVTLVCKQKEADRLPYFQDAITGMGGTTRFAELVVPDETLNFDKIDLKRYLRTGRTSVFVLPTWASQDFVMAFLRKLKESKGNNKVEVYGMPQWQNFEAIEPEYLSSLNVHITVASFVDYTAQDIKDFQQKFYEKAGTIPDDDGFNGYDVTLFTGRMLARYGLSFPEKMTGQPFGTLRGKFVFNKIYRSGTLDGDSAGYDYLENMFVHLLKFDRLGYVPVE